MRQDTIPFCLYMLLFYVMASNVVYAHKGHDIDQIFFPSNTWLPVIIDTLKLQPPQKKKASPFVYKDQTNGAIKYLDFSQGLNSSYIFDIEEDQWGNMWMASQTGGLICYDGHYFESFGMEEGLPSNEFYRLFFDSKEHLWFSNHDGNLYHFNGKDFLVYMLPSDLLKNTYFFHAETTDGHLWLTSDHGLIRFNGEAIKIYTTKEGLPNNELSNILINQEGELIVSTVKGLAKYNPERDNFIKYNLATAIDTSDIFTIIQAKNGAYWISTLTKLHYIHKDQHTIYDSEEQLGGKRIEILYVDQDDNLFFANYKNGLHQFDGKEFRHYTSQDGLSGQDIKRIFQDSYGNIWLGTFGGGVCMLDKDAFKHYYHESNSITGTTIFTLANGQVVTASSKAYQYFDGHSFKRFSANHPLNEMHLTDIITDQLGHNWYGTNENGLYHYNGKKWINYTTKNDLFSDYVRSLTTDQKGTIWFSNWLDGITSYKAEEGFKHYTSKNDFPVAHVSSLFFDNEQNMWLGSWQQGIYLMKDGQLSPFPTKFNLTMGVVMDIYQDSQGYLWFVTDQGLLRYDKTKKDYKYWTAKDGLSSTHTVSIIEDDYRDIWVGTEKGLSRLSPIDENTYHIQNYGLNEGFTGGDCVPKVAVKDTTGRLWWTTSNQITSYLPQAKSTSNNNKPKIQLKQLQLLMNDVDWSAIHQHTMENKELSAIEMSGITEWSKLPINLSLKHNQNHLTFHYAGIDWEYPNDLVYQYRLEGLHEQWSPIAPDMKAVYSNLPPGNYRFRVKAKNVVNEWSEEKEFAFSIQPAIWQTKWFYLALFLIGLTIIIAFTRWRLRSLRENQKELQRLVHQRTLALQHSNQELQLLNQTLNSQKSQIEEQNKQITLITDNVPAGIAYIDAVYRLQFANNTFKEWFALKDQDILMQPIKQILGDDFLDMSKEEHQQLMNGETVAFERKVEQAEVSKVINGFYVPHYDTTGALKGFFVLLEDITDLKTIQNKLLASNRELKDFASVASHDMKEPLRMIESFSGLLEKRYIKQLDSQGIEYLFFIKDASRRMSILLKDLLNYASADQDQKATELVDLNEVLEMVKHNLHLKIQETNTTIITDKLPTVHIHFTPILQVFQNIIANGIKFQPKYAKVKLTSSTSQEPIATDTSLDPHQPIITIQYNSSPKEHIISIQDNGIGIAPENVSKIFNIFKRLHNRNEYEGSGIGLATCKKIINRYEGRIWLDSKQGEGTVFYFSLKKG